MGMLLPGLFLLLLCCSACSYQVRRLPRYDPFIDGPDLDWDELEKIIDAEEAHTSEPMGKAKGAQSGGYRPRAEARMVPKYLRVQASTDRDLFKPQLGVRPVPQLVRDMLLASAPPTTVSPEMAPVEVLCHVDRIYVKIARRLFSRLTAYLSLSLGNCRVNQIGAKYFYFIYSLGTDCGYMRKSNADLTSLSNVLRFIPDPSSPVVRELGFSVPLECLYHRFFHSYKVGFYPIIEGATIHISLTPTTNAIIIPQDEFGNEISGDRIYSLGQPMRFSAILSLSAAQYPGNQRMYVDRCYMTANQDPNSKTKYTVIEEQGCMIDSKVTGLSKFVAESSKLRLTFYIAAFIFQNMVSSASVPKQLYMHCEIAVGPSIPSESYKACSYDWSSRTWKELYGDDRVCFCCDSSCSSTRSKTKGDTKKIVSSHSWEVDYGSRKTGYVEYDPEAKSFQPEAFNMAEHAEFLGAWADDF